MKIYIIDDEPEFFLNGTKSMVTAVAFREYIDGRNTRSVWVLPDGRVGHADALLDTMVDGVPHEHGGWSALSHLAADETELRASCQITASVFEVVWANAVSRDCGDLIRRWPHREPTDGGPP